MSASATKYLDSLVAPEYVISREDIAESLSIDIVDDKLQFSEILVRSRQELQEYLLTSVSWIEFLSRRKAVLTSLTKQKKHQCDKTKALKMNEFMKEKNYARGSKSEAESHVLVDEEVSTMEQKIVNYEAYVQYLSDLIKQLEMFHYVCKDMAKEEAKTLMKY